MSALSLSSIIKLIQKSKYGVTCGRLAAFSIAPVWFNVVACNGDVALCIQGSLHHRFYMHVKSPNDER